MLTVDLDEHSLRDERSRGARATAGMGPGCTLVGVVHVVAEVRLLVEFVVVLQRELVVEIELLLLLLLLTTGAAGASEGKSEGAKVTARERMRARDRQELRLGVELVVVPR